MSLRKGFLLLGTFKHLQRNQSVNKALICQSFKQHVRHSGHSRIFYRTLEENKKNSRTLDRLMAFFWWWILWNLFTEYDELIGPTFPDPSKLTDEELGIPPL